jgi:hypothetical protein
VLSDDDLDIQGEDEQALFNLIKNRTFIHTKAYNADLLIKTGMHIDFENVENVIGWGNFAFIPGEGLRLLTIQFLCVVW